MARWWTIGEQPGLHAAATLDVAGGIPPRAQERVLDDILGEASRHS